MKNAKPVTLWNYMSYLCFFMALFIYSLSSYALPGDGLRCKEEIIMSYTNLDKAVFSNRFYITTKVESLLNAPEADAYSLSMPLIVSAQLGNEDLYRRALTQMNKAMTQVDSGPFKAWLYGRILLAAHSMKDMPTEMKTQATLSALLDGLIKDDVTRLDRFTVWALGYIGALNKEAFGKAQIPMLEGANYLTNEYFKINSSTASQEKKQEARSDAIWAWVMIAQAAANADEKDVYENAIEQMMTITEQSSIGEALSKGLLRTAASNDYPAWAMSIVSLASQTIGDDARHASLESPLQESIKEAKLGDKTQETLLAMVNAQLGIERQNRIEKCSSLQATSNK